MHLLRIARLAASVVAATLLAALFRVEGSAAAQPSQSAQPAQPDACSRGTALAASGANPPVAILLLERCHRNAPSRETRSAMKDVQARLTNKAPTRTIVSLSLAPDSARARLIGATAHGYEAEPLQTDDELWLPEGRYELLVEAQGHEGGRYLLVVDSPEQMLMSVRLPRETPAAETEIDLGAEAGAQLGQVESAADPRPKEFETLLADRYRRAPAPAPIPASDKPAGRGPWPYLSASLAAASLAGGVYAQVQEQRAGAILGYAGALAFGGLAAYLWRSSSPSAVTIVPSPDRGVTFAFGAAF